jgi:outer membrane receptor protein involved in Fe transport
MDASSRHGRSLRLSVVLFAVSLPFLTLGARDAAAQAANTGTIAGTVVARDGGRPVADATVMVEGTTLTAIANGVGRFRLDGVPAGQTIVVASGPGFLQLRIPSVQVSASQTTPLIIELEVTPNILERVQVTATKSELSIGDVAAQADIVERSTIDIRNDQSLVQAVSRVPGVVVATQLGMFESVQLRGMPRDGNEFTNTLLMIDGVPQVDSRNSARTVGLPIHDAGAIEVIRGPNSALYGRTAIGGSINVRTADPAPQPAFGVDFTGGQFGMAKGVVKASGPAGTWGGYYVSAESERASGFYKSKTEDVESDRWSLFGKLTFAPDAKSAGFITVNGVRSDNSTPTNEPFIDGRLLHEIEPGFDRLTSFNIPGPSYHHGEDRITLNYTRQLSSWARVTEIFGYRNVQAKFIDDGDFIGSPFDLEANTLTMLPFSQQADEDIVYQELSGEFTAQAGVVKHSLIVGGSYEHNSGSLTNSEFFFTEENEDGFTINYLNPVIPPRSEWLSFTGTPRVYHLGNTGVFFQNILQPAPRVILTGAGRYDRLALDNQRGTGPKLEQTFEAFSPKVSATVKLAGVDANSPLTVNLYGGYSQAFLPPRAPSALTAANVADNIQPEDIENYEVGMKGSAADGRVSFETTFFRMKEEGVVLSIRQGPFFIPTNDGELKYKGVETGLRVAASPKVSLYVNASFYRNRFGDFVIQDEEDPTADVSLTGNRLAISPDHVVNWGATYMPTAATNINFDVKHVGDTATDRENTFTVPAYTLVDVAASWRGGPLRVTLSAHNLFNEEYYWSGGSETLDPGRPRQVLVTTSFLFK